ncbi:MAG: DUF1007 family protein [Alphaproteobacteria bacterium]
MRNLFFALLMLAVVQIGPLRLASAHPHVWVDALAFMGFDEGRLTTIRMQWAFDEFFSEILFQDFDWNDNGQFDEDELAAMRQGAFEGLGEVNFFTDFRIGGEQVSWDGARDFGVAVSEDGRTVAYSFTLDVPGAPDPYTDAISLSIYDPEFYVELNFIDDEPLRFRDLPGGACGYSFVEATDNPIYFGLVTPIRAEILCEEVTG